MEENRYMKIKAVDGISVDENGRIDIRAAEIDEIAGNLVECDLEFENQFVARLKELFDLRASILAELVGIRWSKHKPADSGETPKQKSDDEIRDLDLKLWETRIRISVLEGAGKFIPADFNGAVTYFENVKRDAAKKISWFFDVDATREKIADFVAAGIACYEADRMLEALTGDSESFGI